MYSPYTLIMYSAFVLLILSLYIWVHITLIVHNTRPISIQHICSETDSTKNKNLSHYSTRIIYNYKLYLFKNQYLSHCFVKKLSINLKFIFEISCGRAPYNILHNTIIYHATIQFNLQYIRHLASN